MADQELQKKNKAPEILANKMNNYDLIDIWREITLHSTEITHCFQTLMRHSPDVLGHKGTQNKSPEGKL